MGTLSPRVHRRNHNPSQPLPRSLSDDRTVSKGPRVHPSRPTPARTLSPSHSLVPAEVPTRTYRLSLPSRPTPARTLHPSHSLVPAEVPTCTPRLSLRRTARAWKVRSVAASPPHDGYTVVIPGLRIGSALPRSRDTTPTLRPDTRPVPPPRPDTLPTATHTIYPDPPPRSTTRLTSPPRYTPRPRPGIHPVPVPVPTPQPRETNTPASTYPETLTRGLPQRSTVDTATPGKDDGMGPRPLAPPTPRNSSSLDLDHHDPKTDPQSART